MMRSKIVILSFLFCLLLPSVALAVSPTDNAEDAEKVRLNSISQNCDDIKKSLTRLEYADSRTRTYLGADYETVLNSFITPLSIRLVKNNIVDASLLTLQTQFSTAQASFRNHYTDYMRELESLINTDCAANPQAFSDLLQSVRNKRSELQGTTVELSRLITAQYAAVQKLQEGL